MTKGIDKNVISIVRKRCPECGQRQSKKSNSRGKFIVYETKFTWKLKCIKRNCSGVILIKKRETDIRESLEI